MKIDMHVHSKEGSICSEITVKEIIDILKSKGFNGVLFTDHESIEGYRIAINLNTDTKFKIFCGFEYSTTIGDMIVILPEIEAIEYDNSMTPENLIKIVHDKKGVIGIAHMYRCKINSLGLAIDDDIEELYKLGYNNVYERFSKILEDIDFIEVENSKCTESENFTALYNAKDFNKTETKGSDSHSINETGKTGTIFTTNIETQIDLINSIKNKKVQKNIINFT